MVKDYTRPRALQRAAWAAKGKDNVLAAQNWGLWLPHFFNHFILKELKKIKEEKKNKNGCITGSCKGCGGKEAPLKLAGHLEVPLRGKGVILIH